MKRENSAIPQEFPYDLTDDLGEIISSEWQCPGVYYVATDSGESAFALECYIVERNSGISDAAKKYGTPMPSYPNLLAFDVNAERGGAEIIRYEIGLYRVKNNLPLPDNEPLLVNAVYGREDHPEYFGAFPAPTYTPRGFTTRYKALMNGVFVLETDRGERMLAVCHPFADSTFSGYTLYYSEQTDFDRERGLDNTLGCLFFPEKAMCLAIFELLPGNPKILRSGMIGLAELCNAIWYGFPEYAARYNSNEQAGVNDMLAHLLGLLGMNKEPEGSENNLITLNLDAGTDFLRF